MLTSISLDNPIWKSLKGGYRTEYDVSIPLKRLEKAINKNEMQPVFDELWNELHHQGDVDVASYLAIPHLIRIAREKNVVNWNIFALCATIEQQRHVKRNPKLPEEFTECYLSGLNDLKSYALLVLTGPVDDLTFRAACSALSTSSGHIKLGKAIIELDEATLDEFLDQF